jgi:hypothetical protein
LSGTPLLSNVAVSGAYSDLANVPALSNVAITGSYRDLADGPSNVSSFFNDVGYILQGQAANLSMLTVQGVTNLGGHLVMANNANITTFVSPQFNGSFWTIGDNPITRPSALSQALKIGGYIFDGASILWDGAQQAQLMYNQGKPDPKLAQDVAEQLNDPGSDITINWNAVSQRPIANQTSGGFVEIGIPNNLYMDGKIYRDAGVFSGVGGGANWGSPDKTRAVLDIGQASANLHSLASNNATIPVLTSSRCTLTGNLTVTGASTSSIPELSTNNLTSNVCVVSNLYATTIDAENMQVDGNLTTQSLRVLGNLQANTASFPYLSTESLTGNIVVCRTSLHHHLILMDLLSTETPLVRT